MIDEPTESEKPESPASVEESTSTDFLHIRMLVANGYQVIPCNITSTPLIGKTYDMRELAAMRIEQEKTVQPPVIKILQNLEWNRLHKVHRTSILKTSWMNSVDPWSVKWIKKMPNTVNDD